MSILLVVHRETLHDYLYWASKWASCWLYTEKLFMTIYTEQVMSILLVVHRETLHDYLYWTSKWASCWLYTEKLFMTIYTEQVNEHPVGCTQRNSSWLAILSKQMSILLVVHREPLHDYLYWASKWASCWLYTEKLFMTSYTEQVNEHPVGCTQRNSSWLAILNK